MLRELLHIFRPGNPLSDMADRFAKMIGFACEITITAGNFFDGRLLSAEERSEIYTRDVKINKLERKIRKRVVTHLSLAGNRPSLPYCLLLISLVKDVERLGDYAKNLAELGDLYNGDLPADEIMAELQEIRAGVERAFQSTGETFRASDHQRAIQLIAQGKGYARRCDDLLVSIAASDYRAGLATTMALGTRYYKRIGGHLLNILSSVVMPLHKVDYYDEDSLPVGIPDGEDGPGQGEGE
jgi:phosphate transport system protein